MGLTMAAHDLQTLTVFMVILQQCVTWLHLVKQSTQARTGGVGAGHRRRKRTQECSE